MSTADRALLRRAAKLMDQAADRLPQYVDGRNDKLADALNETARRLREIAARTEGERAPDAGPGR